MAALQYAPNGWRRPTPPHIHLAATVALNFVGAVLIGSLVARLQPWATSRLRATAVGVVASLPCVPLVYLTVYPTHLRPLQLAVAVAAIAVVGAMFGAGLWEGEDG